MNIKETFQFYGRALRRETELATRLKSQIRHEGPMSFKDFMQVALYDPDRGFYSKAPGIGDKEGAFNTNAMFRAFAFALSRAIEQAEVLVGTPLRILEFGGGTGELGSNILSFLSTSHDYVIVDVSIGFRHEQAARGIRTVENVHSLSKEPTFAFGNEVLDAFPVHRVMGDGSGQLLELFVGVDEQNNFVYQPGSLSTELLAERLRSEGVVLGRGQVAEVCLDLENFIRDAGSVISKGYLMLIDYGDEAPTLYSYTRSNGTLRSFCSQQLASDPFDGIGEQDLTADVDFTALKATARNAGFVLSEHLQQGPWLRHFGIEDYIKLSDNSQSSQDEVDQLTSPTKLGSTFDIFMFKTSGLPNCQGPYPI